MAAANFLTLKLVDTFNSMRIYSIIKNIATYIIEIHTKRYLPSEFFFEMAVSATESSLRLAFIGRPLFVTSAENKNKNQFQ